MNDSDENDINLQDAPCLSCSEFGGKICDLDCPKLAEYGRSTEIRPDIYYKKKADLDTAMELESQRDLHKAMEKEQRSLAEGLDEKGIKPELAPRELDEQVIFTEEDLSYDQEDYVNVVSPISLIKVDEMMALFKETRIIKSFEKELAEQLLSYMRCAKIAVIARLARLSNRQNLHIKIARRIVKLGRYMLKDKARMSQIKRKVNITVEDVLTPHKFKQYLRVES